MSKISHYKIVFTFSDIHTQDVCLQTYRNNRICKKNTNFTGKQRSFIKRQTSGTSSDSEWQRVTANDNEWYNEWQPVTTSGTTSDNEW